MHEEKSALFQPQRAATSRSARLRRNSVTAQNNRATRPCPGLAAPSSAMGRRRGRGGGLERRLAVQTRPRPGTALRPHCRGAGEGAHGASCPALPCPRDPRRAQGRTHPATLPSPSRRCSLVPPARGGARLSAPAPPPAPAAAGEGSRPPRDTRGLRHAPPRDTGDTGLVWGPAVLGQFITAGYIGLEKIGGLEVTS